MKIVSLIAEYNPFHNGHQYHIEKAKELTGADMVLVVMSGNFVQRGTPAMLPKHLRTDMALHSGASLVLELPVCYATGSAEQFAYGAVSLLEKLSCVDALCFGSECGDIKSLTELADILCEESDDYKTCLKQHLKNGLSYPLARQQALATVYPDKDFSDILAKPNNILGVEYLKALRRIESKITSYTISRISSDYHDTSLQTTYSSATALRQVISTGELSSLHGQIPADCIELLEKNYNLRYPVYANDFSLLLKYRLLSETKETLTEYADVSEELANRIYNRRNDFLSFEQFCELLKTKELTYSRISRALLHVILGIKKSDDTDITYARVLGFRKDSVALLSELKRCSSIPLLTKLTNFDSADLKRDIYASDLYESVVTEKFKTKFINEYQQNIIITDISV